MNVILTPELEEMVRAQIESGRYDDAGEVVREALRRMLREDRDRFERLRAAVIAGCEAAERGETVTSTPELMERLKREATEAARAGTPISDDVKP